MRIVFMGTPEFAVPSLQSLLDADPQSVGRVVGVVTQPDRPKGRGGVVSAPPVKVLAQKAGLPVLQPLKMKDESFLTSLKGWAPDLIAVTAFAMKGDEERIRQGGCEAYLSKPISVGKFLETVRHFLA